MSGTRSEEKDDWTVADIKKQASTFTTVQLLYSGRCIFATLQNLSDPLIKTYIPGYVWFSLVTTA
jgi:hypothetical protein